MITEKLRIIHVLRAPLGGLFRHVIDLASAQAALGHEIGMFFDGAARSERVDEALARIPGGWALGVGEAGIARNPGPTDLFALAKFRAFVARARPDVIHGHGAKGGLMARLTRLSQPPGAPIAAYTPHGGSFNYKAGSLVHHLYMTVERGLAPLTDLFLFESAYIASRYDRFVGVDAGLRRIVFNGLKPSEFEPIAPDADALDLVFIGELREAKGVDTLIAALPLLKPRRQAPRLALIGAGPDLEQFRRQAERLGVADRIDIPRPPPRSPGFSARTGARHSVAPRVAALRRAGGRRGARSRRWRPTSAAFPRSLDPIAAGWGVPAIPSTSPSASIERSMRRAKERAKRPSSANTSPPISR